MTTRANGSQWAATTYTGADVTINQFKEYLRGEIAKAGSLRELARRTNLQPSSISRVLSGEDLPSDNFLAVFGFKRRITIVRK